MYIMCVNDSVKYLMLLLMIDRSYKYWKHKHFSYILIFKEFIHGEFYFSFFISVKMNKLKLNKV